ncbi:pilin outer membrane usher protein SafC [Lelliottia aquatilis]|uniref:fimbria/pilus outer membrane usher protein n=1 Tax=Lelliottia aquatilis TaxID=2080838 RepID=UPI000CDF138E|nr:fimbria/pilus outer membrane usher protein [Lelliottia aquatilis]POZ16197.1 pilin outer membrane usher protein SafC [Lelliottia aquatilis]
MKYTRLALAIGLVCLLERVSAKEWAFDEGVLGGAVDVSVFNAGGQMPGNYQVDVLLNGERVDTRDIKFSAVKDAQGRSRLQPCLSAEQLSHYGVKTDDYPDLLGKGGDGSGDTATGEGTTKGDDKAGACVHLEAISQAKAEYNFNEQQLLLSIPQVALRPELRGIAPTELWDDGVPALLLNYNANTSKTTFASGNEQSSYVQLNPGANLGAWRLRNQTNWQRQGDEPGKWQTLMTYAERGLYENKSRLTVGERFTPSDIFDTVPFRGVMVGTDNSMVPYYQREFAPVVRGIARTQARVEVKQNGYTVYSASVAPGPFALTDLSVPGSGGDLEVTVRESDGQQQVFTVPYQTPAIALREGYLDYNVMMGQYRPAQSGTDRASVGQFTLMYGLPWNLTAYGGLQGAEHFNAVAVGLGMSLGDWGSLSLDAIESRGTRRREKTEKGGTWRVRYSKEFDTTNTTFTLASYQYASSGYYSLSDVLDSYGYDAFSDAQSGYNGDDRRKSTTSMTVSQSIGEVGSLSMSGRREDYWNRPGHEETFSLGYSVGFKQVTASLNWSRSKHIGGNGDNGMDNLTNLSLSFPLDQWLGGNTYASYQYTAPSQSPGTQDLQLSGQGFDRQLNWNLSQSYQAGEENRSSDSSAVNLNWQGQYGVLGGGYRYSPDTKQVTGSVSGGMVAYAHGVTFGQPLSDTVGVIEAPGASGVEVSNWPGVKTDFRGYTLMSRLSAYQENTLNLDPTSLAGDADIEQTSVKVIPTQGAVIPARFRTRVGARGLMTLSRKDGSVIPLGAVVQINDVTAGIMGDDGQVYLTGLPDKGTLLVKWGGKQQCEASYTLPAEKGPAGIYVMKGECE